MTRGRPRDQVVEMQRARILAAAVDVVAESGYAALTVGAVVQRARISRKTFSALFANRDTCFLAVVDEIFTRAHLVVSAAYAAESGWLDATRAALESLLRLIDEEPSLARIWFVDALAGPDAVRARRAEATAMLVAAVDAGRGVADVGRQPPRLTAEATVGALWQILHKRLANGHDEPCLELLGPCMYLVALPYLGVARARAELRRKPSLYEPPGNGADTQRSGEPLRGTTVRVTYRTTRTLDVISARPGMSNRTVAEESGINDQGQASKLLSRLERLALIENRGLGKDRGAPNAWHLTTRGVELIRAIGLHEATRPHDTP
jgi:TetR/AcrR family transcriptional regulator